MGKCIIVGACQEAQRDFDYDDEDFIIASDGGLAFLLERNYRVDLCVGDFDSFGRVPNCTKIKKLNPIKDITDTNACINEGINLGFREFEIYGCLGGRIDHSIAIIQDAYKIKKMGYDIRLYSSNQVIFFIDNEKKEIKGRSGDYISVFSYEKEAKGVSIKNLKYELEDAILSNNFPLGVSNNFTNEKATIEVKDGCLLIVM